MNVQSTNVSRRTFVTTCGAAAGVAALAGTAAAGSASAAEAAGADDGAEAQASAPAYTVYDADVIVIGAGMTALSAVDEAINEGQSVLMIDKAPYGFGGATGMNWDVVYTWNPSGDPSGTANGCTVELRETVNEEDRYRPNDYTVIANRGEVLSDRNDDGSVHFKIDYPTAQGVEWGFPRHWADYYAQNDAVTVHDYTMITDIFVNDGRCVGCVGIYLPTGEYRVYRSKATVLATGGSTQMYGYVTLSSISNQSVDNTGDVDMGIYRHGGRIGDAEHGAYDMMGVSPSCWAVSEGAMFGGDSMDIDFMFDNEGVAFCLDEKYDRETMVNDRQYFNQVVAQHIQDGYAGPNGGIYLPANEEIRGQMRYMYLRAVDRIESECGIDLAEEPMECLIEMYEHGGTPVVDGDLMSTEFEGLFCARGAGVAGCNGGSTNIRERQYGQYAMKRAIAYANSAAALEAIDFADAEREIARLEDLRTRTSENGIRPLAIQRKIQQIGYDCLNVVRPLDVLEAGRAELKRIEEEELPLMCLSDHAAAYNRDWKDAIETINLLDLTRISIEATYVRPESRGNFLRPEYPEANEDWDCVLGFYKDENGDLAFDKIAL
jgi:succinate dehydrogenase / fumarate reductase flavoprotein subunit